MTQKPKCGGDFEELALISPRLFNSLLERLPSTPLPEKKTVVASEPSTNIREELKNRAAQKMNEALSQSDTKDPANATRKIKLYKKALSAYKKQVIGHSPLKRFERVPKTSTHFIEDEDSDATAAAAAADDDDDDNDDDNEEDDDDNFVSSDEGDAGTTVSLRDHLRDQLTENQMDSAETILRYIKRSEGRISYDPSTTELLIDNEHIKNSSLPSLIVSLVRSLRTEEGVGHTGQLQLAHALVTGERMAKSVIKNKMLLKQLATSKPPVTKTSWGDRKRDQRK